MKALREEQVAQALIYLRTMKAAKLFSDAVTQRPEFLRGLWAEIWDCKELADKMKTLEESGSLPYFVTHEECEAGKCYSILTVSPYKEDFVVGAPHYVEELGAYRAYAYVWNVTNEDFSESGSVILKNKDGILVRIR